jgi:hypothetical protein
MPVVDHLEFQLARFAEGQYTLDRLIDLSKDRLESAWGELTRQDVDYLDSWLSDKIRASNGEERLRWGFVRGIFETIRELRGLKSALAQAPRPRR